MSVAISLVSTAISGGGIEIITSADYATSTEAEAAVTARGFLPVPVPVDQTGKTLKKRHLAVASIREIASL